MTQQTITRCGTFDAGHRILNERMKCFSIHGHTYHYELTFSFQNSRAIGYAIDFKEIKRIACQWIDDVIDHGLILNPEDKVLIKTARELNSKMWIMSLNGENNYCNPTVENIAKELFIAVQLLFEHDDLINIAKIRLHETPNCYTDCYPESLSQEEIDAFKQQHATELARYAQNKGTIEYDDRLV